MGYLVSNGRNGRVEYSGTQYVNPSAGTKKLCIRTGTGPNDVIRYGLTTKSSASAYCGLRMRIDGNVAYIGRSGSKSVSRTEIGTKSVFTSVSTSVSSLSSSKTSKTESYQTTTTGRSVVQETVWGTSAETQVSTFLRTVSSTSSSTYSTTYTHRTSTSKSGTVKVSLNTFTVAAGYKSYSTVKTSILTSSGTASKTIGYGSVSGTERGAGIDGLVGNVSTTRLSGTNTFSTLSSYTYNYYTTYHETISRIISSRTTMYQTQQSTWGWTSTRSDDYLAKLNYSSSVRYSYTTTKQASKLSTKEISVQISTTSQSVGTVTIDFVTSVSSTTSSSASQTVEITTSSSFLEDNFDL